MSTTSPTQRKRRLLILLLGLGLLIAITLLGSSLESLIPHRPSAPVQTVQGGPYQVTLQVTPNPPSLSQQADLSLQIVRRATRQLVTTARVEIEITMETMDMGSSRLPATQQNNGSYLA